MQRPLVLGLAFAVGTAVWLGWLVRRWSDFRGLRARLEQDADRLGSGILLAFVLTNTRYPIPATELAVTTVVYLTPLSLEGVATAPFAVWRSRQAYLPCEHRPDDVVEVWHVRDRSRGATYEPYFVGVLRMWLGQRDPRRD
jgi:hypothetical protein